MCFRATALSLLLAVGIGSAGCSESPIAPLFPHDAPPTAFSVSYSAWIYGVHSVDLHGDTLVIVRVEESFSGRTTTTRVLPTHADWQAFWQAVDAAGIRRWPLKCENNSIVDGAGFSVEIAYDGGRVQSSGGNSYPRRDGGCTKDGSRSAEFDAFAKAVGGLIGTKWP